MIKKIFLLIAIILPSPIRIRLLRLLGYKISKKAKLGLFSWVSAQTIEIGDYSKIGSLSIIKCGKSLILGENLCGLIVNIFPATLSANKKLIILYRYKYEKAFLLSLYKHRGFRRYDVLGII